MRGSAELTDSIYRVYNDAYAAVCCSTSAPMHFFGDSDGGFHNYPTAPRDDPVEVALPEQEYCAYCWSWWKDAAYHPGTCGNCGAPGYKARKPESEMPWEKPDIPYCPDHCKYVEDSDLPTWKAEHVFGILNAEWIRNLSGRLGL